MHYFYSGLTFRSLVLGASSEQLRIVVCKNENQTCKEKTGINSCDVTNKKYTTLVITTCSVTEKLLHLPKLFYYLY